VIASVNNRLYTAPAVQLAQIPLHQASHTGQIVLDGHCISTSKSYNSNRISYHVFTELNFGMFQ